MEWIDNKRIVITGATSGIGKRVATRLASLGGQVVLACRDDRKGGEVAEEINALAGAERASIITLDVSDRDSIRDFASEFRHTFGTLDVLVNNAGVLAADRQVTGDGIELTFATNVLGYYLVTAELLDLLKAGVPSRVVNVASTFAGELDLEDLQFERRPYNGIAAYAQSKACNRMLTWALARRLGDGPVTVNAMAPGLVMETDLYRQLTAEQRDGLARYGTRGLPEAAETAVWLAGSTDVAGATGKFFELGEEIPCQFRDPDAEEKLWQLCERLTHQLQSS